MSQLITIHKYNSDDVRAVVDPDDQSVQSPGIMRGDGVTLSFIRPDYIDFQIGDYCTIFGSFYELNLPPPFTKNAQRNYQYTLALEGYYYRLTRVQYLALNIYNAFTEGKFSLRGKPIDFVTLLVTNMNRVFPDNDWSVGTVLDADYQDIDFDGQNCMDVLTTLASNFLTEFTITGTTINLIQTQTSAGVTLTYGLNNPLYTIGRDLQNSSLNPITRLYAYGSDQNLGTNYRGGAPRLRMAAALFIDKNVTLSGIYEGTIVFDGTNGLPLIYPHRTGTVTGITDIHTFQDAAIDFNLNDYLIDGVTAQITFNTGLLGGSTFDIQSYDDGTKTIVIKDNTSAQTITLPSDTLSAAIGDEYVIINITMPIEYISDAEALLLTTAQQWLAKNGPAQLLFQATNNVNYFRQNNIVLQLGKAYNLVDADSNINRQIRLMSFDRNLRKPFMYANLVFADTVTPQTPAARLLKTL